jgi:hypothetical protein
MALEERIRRRAYEIWEFEGCPEGRAIDHWVLAEIELSKSAGLALEDALPAGKPKKAALRANAKPRTPRATPPKARKSSTTEITLN